MRPIKGIRRNNRFGSKREPVGSTIVTPPNTEPLESRRQTRALRGAKGFPYAVTSNARPTWAGPVQVLKPANAPKGTRRRRHKDAGTYTRNLGGSTPQEYVYGTG